ncbi:hypothetical protein BAUCODRAFT_35005 [Baudoinia panamericana UAMH 10762]|uniref:Uncharacterized protein n=1 Tax=Baudoinia panamericana (strain UAMH 10762) TaxID=717646 RepID=M2LL79_BAUPA|nr:uncharacterized protein BAUCODRAFT_35005 [Baudoinia panamericana UAMH 10762]EMC95012.1 hypothetical protein BAUCODRAFT_35005 [Baudoinia panamericana UAMH 10762]
MTANADSFRSFCDRMDGFTRLIAAKRDTMRAERTALVEEVGSSSATLPYIPKVADLKLCEFCPEADGDSDGETQQHRQGALDALNGSTSIPAPSITHGAPRKVRHPDSLLPGKSAPVERKPLVTPSASTARAQGSRGY